MQKEKFFQLMISFILCVALLTSCYGPKEVETVQLTPHKMTLAYTVEGQALSLHKEVVLPVVSGVLSEISVHVGDIVTQGQVLAKLDEQLLQEQLAVASSSMMTEPVHMEGESEEVKRARNLVKEGIITEKEFSHIVQKNTSSVVTMAVNNEVVADIKRALENSVFKAPISGVVTAIYDGGHKLALAGQPLFVVQQENPVMLVFSLPNQILSKLKESKISNTSVFVQMNGEKLIGEITHLEKDNISNEGLGKAVFENTGKFILGEFYTLTLENSSLHTELTLPKKVIHRGKEGDFVYVVTPNSTVDIKHITIGSEVDNRVSVVEGLTTSDRVISSSGDFVLGEKVEVNQG